MAQDRRLTGFAREMRRNPTHSEKVLWSALKDRRLLGEKFRRQVPIEGFVADFLCERLKLIVELDGDLHLGKETYDLSRKHILEGAGYTVLRLGSEIPVEFGYSSVDYVRTEVQRLQAKLAP